MAGNQMSNIKERLDIFLIKTNNTNKDIKISNKLGREGNIC